MNPHDLIVPVCCVACVFSFAVGLAFISDVQRQHSKAVNAWLDKVLGTSSREEA